MRAQGAAPIAAQTANKFAVAVPEMEFETEFFESFKFGGESKSLLISQSIAHHMNFLQHWQSCK